MRGGKLLRAGKVIMGAPPANAAAAADLDHSRT
jgi:hypothetical protein